MVPGFDSTDCRLPMHESGHYCHYLSPRPQTPATITEYSPRKLGRKVLCQTHCEISLNVLNGRKKEFFTGTQVHHHSTFISIYLPISYPIARGVNLFIIENGRNYW